MRLLGLGRWRPRLPRHPAAWWPLLLGGGIILWAVAMMLGWSGQAGTATTRIETNLLALLPNTERNPVAEKAVAHLNTQLSDRVMVAIRMPADTRLVEQAYTQPLLVLAQRLEALSVIQQVTAQVPPLNPNGLRDLYAPHLAGLADPAYWQTLQQQDQAGLETTLQQRLYQPLGLGTLGGNSRSGDEMSAPNLVPLAQDPFGMFNRFLGQTPYLRNRLNIEAGWLTATLPSPAPLSAPSPEKFVLLIAQLRDSAFSVTVQEQLEAWRLQGEAELQQTQSHWQLWVSGTVRYASVARQSAQQDMDRIGWLSLLGIAALLAWAYRSLGPILLGWTAILVGAAAAVLVVIAVDGKLHLLTLVFGASLLGETIDYAIQFFAARAQAGQNWVAACGMQSIRPALRMGLLTSVLGYAALGVLPLAGIRQIALFAAAGLLVAYAMVGCLLPAWLAHPISTQHHPSHRQRWVQALLQRWQHPCSPRLALLLLALMAGVGGAGLFQVRAEDDVRLLNNPPSWLRQQEDLLRQAIGQQQGLQFFLVEGRNDDEVLAREQQLRSALAPYRQQGWLQGVQALSQMVPSESAQRAQQAAVVRWSQSGPVQAALSRTGFTAQAIQNWQAQLSQSQPLTLQDWLRQPYATPWRHLWLGAVAENPADQTQVASVVFPLWGNLAPDAAMLTQLAHTAQAIPGVTWVDKTTSVSRLLGQLRERATLGLLVVLALVGAVLVWRYRLRVALQLLAPTVLALIVTLGLWGWLGTAITLFHIMALLLVIGVGVNYAIFAHEGQQQVGAATRPDAVLLGVGLSACTTLLSFGLLGLSSTPALQHFGSALAAGVLLTLLFTPLCLRGLGAATVAQAEAP